MTGRELVRNATFWGAHIVCLLVVVTGVSPIAVVACIALYSVRLFGITGGYHRYFAHKSFKASRPMQLLLAILGAMAAQKGPIWWTSHHRHHHGHADKDDDVHSPTRQGFWWAHVGWILSTRYLAIREKSVKDLTADGTLCFIDKYHGLFPLALAIGCYVAGEYLSRFPALHTDGLQLLIWGFFISTVFLWHLTFCINSLAHLWGSRRFKTDDTSRNNPLLALLLFGEGWHNNHHRYAASERQGFYWWEFDITHIVLKLLALAGVVSQLKEPPARLFDQEETV